MLSHNLGNTILDKYNKKYLFLASKKLEELTVASYQYPVKEGLFRFPLLLLETGHWLLVTIK